MCDIDHPSGLAAGGDGRMGGPTRCWPRASRCSASRGLRIASRKRLTIIIIIMIIVVTIITIIIIIIMISITIILSL